MPWINIPGVPVVGGVEAQPCPDLPTCPVCCKVRTQFGRYICPVCKEHLLANKICNNACHLGPEQAAWFQEWRKKNPKPVYWRNKIKAGK